MDQEELSRAQLREGLDAALAKLAKVRELHAKCNEVYYPWVVCSECMDGEDLAAWPCNTIQIVGEA